MPHPIVYHPTTRANHLNNQLHGLPPLPTQVPLDVPPNLLNGADFVPVFDQYVGFGDTVTVASLTTLFARRGGSVTVRLASKTEFADMRDSPAILIGAFTNRWAVELTQKFRYHFFLDSAHKPAIVDSQTNSRWSTDKADNGHSNEDYVFICRLPKAQTGGFVIVAAGLTQYGTEEAGRILAHPQASDSDPSPAAERLGDEECRIGAALADCRGNAHGSRSYGLLRLVGGDVRLALPDARMESAGHLPTRGIQLVFHNRDRQFHRICRGWKILSKHEAQGLRS